MESRVLVVGSSNTDMVVKIPVLPKPGETVLGGDFVQAAGGKGANQAVAAARLGANVVFVARLGTDVLGDQALRNFRADGISTEFVVRDEGTPSGVALIMVDDSGENEIAVASGANSKLTPADVDCARNAVESCSVVLIQLETPLETVTHAARLGKELGKTVILNPAPALPLEDSLLRNVSIITPNETETEILTGVLPTGETTAKRAAEILMRRGVGSVVITMGERGAYLSETGGSRMVPGHSVKAVDTTAAGDAFNGALACAISSGEDLKGAVNFANRVAAISVTRLGAQPSLPTYQELESLRS